MSSVDRGGLRYLIDVQANLGPLGAFRTEIRQATKDWITFQRALKGSGAGSQAATTRAVREVADANKQLEESTRRITANQRASFEAVRRQTKEFGRVTRATSDSQGRLTRQTIAQRQALRELNTEAQKKETLDRAGVVSARREFQIQRRIANAQAARLNAERRVTDQINLQRREEQLRRVVQERNLQTNTRLLQNLGLLNRAQKRDLRLQRQRRTAVEQLSAAQQNANNQRLIQIRAETEALRLIERNARKQSRDRILQERGFGNLIPGQAAAAPQAKTLSFFRRLTGALTDTDSKANRVAFTFRRLFGILAAFTIARNLVSGFRNLVRTLIEANQTIETSTIGIGAVLAAVGEVRNLQGEIVRGADALVIAQQEARRQARLLRVEALQTTATYEELVEAFQIGLGPGLQAGLDIDQVRRFTRQISLAAQAIGLPQNQLSEEIRSILAGTISIRTTRIAAVLGITNQDIRDAKQTGTLFEFLTDRFQEFEEAGALAADTFEGLRARVGDAARLVLAEGGFPLFEELKESLREILASIQVVDEDSGNIDLNPAFVAAAREIADALASGVRQLRELARGSGVEIIKTTAATIGNFLATSFRLLSGFVKGFGDAARIALGLGGIIQGIFSAISGATASITGSKGPLLEVTRIAGQLLGFAVGIQVAVFVIGLGIRTINALMIVSRGLMVALLVVTRRVAFTSAGIAAAFAAANLPLAIALAAILGILAATGILGRAVSFIGRQVRDISTGPMKELQKQVGGILGDGEQRVDGFINGVSSGLNELIEKTQELNKEIESLVFGNRLLFRNIFGLQDTGFDNTIARLQRSLGALPDDLRARIDAVDNSLEALQGQFNRSVDTILKIVEETEALYENVSSDPAVQEAQSLADEYAAVSKALGLVADARENAFSLDFDPITGEFFVPNLGESEIDALKQADILTGTVEENKQRIEKLNANILRIEKQSQELQERRNTALVEFISSQGLALRAELLALNIEQTREATLRRVSLIFDERIAQAELLATAEEQRLLELQKQQALLVAEEQIRDNEITNNIRRLRLIQEANEATIASLSLTEKNKNLNAAEQERLAQLLSLREELVTQIGLQQQAQTELNTLGRIELAALEEQIRRTQVALGGDEAAQFSLALSESLRSASGQFAEIGDRIQEAIRGARQLRDISASERRSEELRRQNERSAIESEFRSRIALAQLAGDSARQRILELQQSEAIRNQQFTVDRLLIEADIQRLSRQQEINDKIVEELSAKQNSGTATQEELQRLGEIRDLRDEINSQIDQQTVALRLRAQQQSEEQAATEREQLFLEVEESGSLGDQLLLSFIRLEQELPSRFELMLTTLRSAVTGFSQFVGQSITDAFDPTSDGNFLERFARFLQGIATQVIATLTQIAITALILDSLTGGILRSLVGGPNADKLIAAIGKNEGGPITKQDKKKAAASPAHFNKSRGFNDGGRPAGLHPADKIPIWVAENEWVIRASSAIKAGHDALARINAGQFDPIALRSALGLGGGAMRGMTGMARRSPGYNEGGAVRQAAQAAGSAQPTQPALAIIATSRESVRRLFAGGGRAALLDVIGENRSDIRSRLGV